MPPCLMKMGNGFQIFLDNIAPTRQEQHRPARSTAGSRPVETTTSPAVRGGPIPDLAVLRMRHAISRNDIHMSLSNAWYGKRYRALLPWTGWFWFWPVQTRLPLWFLSPP